MSLLLRVRPWKNRFFVSEQLNSYSTKINGVAKETVESTKSGTNKSSKSSSSSSQRVKEQSTDSIIWPKPREIPYQVKVANVVNLVGHVEAPVQSETAADGNLLAAIVISQKSSRGKVSLSIPVVFDGDLAHVVTCHVKQNDCVLVSGRLSEDPLKLLSIADKYGKLHVVAENLNFVEGSKRGISPKQNEASFAGMEVNKPQLHNHLQTGKTLKNSFEKSMAGSGKTSYNNKDEELWMDLVKNPIMWWDYRSHKSNGLVKDKFPDFKQKWSGEGLWLNSAPKWVSAELEKLEFDVKVMKENKVQEVGNGDKKIGGRGREDLWKNLVDCWSMWWDNRLDKRNPKAPDFKHKETGEGVWLNELPDWVLIKLPPTKEGSSNATVDGNRVVNSAGS
ncbi:protein OSB3, chloroplastic/mitochondrial-like [Andrographis paniculata]|uniref:protein OSB3, chloroplastic/mitochondrial-like n=1 Tax=Andrographis paniculata TaxID=175694 RepID=UPI0021E7D625|nr:protein OSB3, chloroplastic/mitochondrial-like [Andrographis paniculata]XP_051124676.1 protein OSB3, chloroplastic/mitochondrial-like [Andrographis paniculata]